MFLRLLASLIDDTGDKFVISVYAYVQTTISRFMSHLGTLWREKVVTYADGSKGKIRCKHRATVFLPRDAMHKRGLCHRTLSVRHILVLCKNIYLKIFFTIGVATRYGNIPTRTSITMAKNRDFRPISDFGIDHSWTVTCRQHFDGGLEVHNNNNNNNNNNIPDSVYGAVIMAEPLREFNRFI